MASGTIKAVVAKSDIADNLTTNDSTKVLSAKQGKLLNDQIANLHTAVISSTYVPANGTLVDSFPTGFNSSNAYAISISSINSGGNQKYYAADYRVALTENGITFINDTSSQVRLVVVLLKI